jgi:hypothetical protein
MTLSGIAAGVGSNLVAEQVQRWVDRTEAGLDLDSSQPVPQKVSGSKNCPTDQRYSKWCGNHAGDVHRDKSDLGWL